MHDLWRSSFVYKKIGLYIAFGQTVIATVGSLFFSEILKLTPCALCWLQRFFMYPLIVVLGLAIKGKLKRVQWWALPLSLGGMILAFFHALIYYGVIPESGKICFTGVSCAARYVELFGFVSIPIMSLSAFGVITLGLLFYDEK
jgi:disulfide bond formation protein DsbB